MRFLGIDLGWQRKPSGLAALEMPSSGRGTLRLLNLDRRTDEMDILQWVEQVAGESDAIIGVDAPLVIPNATGTRECDKLMHRHYGKFHAGAYPANLGLPFAAYTTGFSGKLEAMGFRHVAALGPHAPGRWQFEAFPHASYVQLFGLDRIIQYKRKAGRSVAFCVGELNRLRSLMLERLPQLKPRLAIAPCELPEVPNVGAALKEVEDQLDAVVCAYVAAWYWYWGTARTNVHGSAEDGYIVVPQRVGVEP